MLLPARRERGMNNLLAPTGVSHIEAPGLRFLERSILKNAQGLSPCSSASLYRKMHSSTPCAMLANSLVLTFSSRYSINSGGRVTLSETLRMRGAIINEESWSILYRTNKHSHNTHKLCVGLTHNERNTSNSGRSVRTEEGILRTRLVSGPLLVYRKADDAGPHDSGGRGHRHSGKDLATGPRYLEGHDRTDYRDHGALEGVT